MLDATILNFSQTQEATNFIKGYVDAGEPN